jgi:hypothetical protein
MNLKTLQKTPIFPVVVAGGVGIALYVVYKTIKSTTNALDITKSKEDKEVFREITSNKNPFSATYWKSFKSGNVKILKQAECERLKKIIVDSISRVPFMTNDSAIFSVFRNLQYKTQVSYFAEYFLKTEKIDLLTYIKYGYTFFWGNTGITDSTSKAIITYVNNLPSGNYK